MDTRKIINPIDILWAFQEEPASISSAAESRSTIHRFIVEDTVGWKLAVHSPSGYNTTSVADLIIQYYNELEEDGQNEVASLAALEYGPILLDILPNTTATSKAEMARQSGASRSTVQRNIREFLSDDFEWVSKQNNRYRLTDSGNRVLAAYESFQDKIKVIAEKSEFLERFEEAGLLPSVETLDGSRMVVSTATDRQPVVREITESSQAMRNLFEESLKRLARKSAMLIASKVPPDTESELIVDRPVYKAITNPKRWKYLFRARRRQNFELLVHPDGLTVGAGLFGDEQAMITAYNETNPFHVALFGEDNAFVSWVKKVYENASQEARSPGRDLFKWIAE